MDSKPPASSMLPLKSVCFICGCTYSADDPRARRFFLEGQYREICSNPNCLLDAGYRQYLEEFDALGNMG
jgi:hypothetical protein